MSEDEKVGAGIIATVVLLVILIGAVPTIPYCTTYEDHGVKYCSKLVWGDGTHRWTEDLE